MNNTVPLPKASANGQELPYNLEIRAMSPAFPLDS
jgi:hypothetical protein